MTTTSPRYIDTAECATLVRRVLKAAFPGVKFSVRTERYSMGSHVSVTWIDGPTTEEVEAVAGEFSGSTFDGMTDSRNYHDSTLNGEAVHYAAHDVSCTRHMSDARKAEIEAKIEAATGKPVSSTTVYEEGVTVDGRFYSAGAYRTLYRDELVWRIFNEARSPAKTEPEEAPETEKTEDRAMTEQGNDTRIWTAGQWAEFCDKWETQLNQDEARVHVYSELPYNDPATVFFAYRGALERIARDRACLAEIREKMVSCVGQA